MTLSLDGELFIKQHEGFSLVPYKDGGGKWTQGWGHTEDITEASPDCDKSKAQEWFKKDVANVERLLSKAIRLELTQCEHDALVSFVFNVGPEKFVTSTLLRNLNNWDRQGAAKEFPKWVYITHRDTGEKKVDKGLVKRREAEMELFLKDLNKAKTLAEA